MEANSSEAYTKCSSKRGLGVSAVRARLKASIPHVARSASGACKRRQKAAAATRGPSGAPERDDRAERTLVRESLLAIPPRWTAIGEVGARADSRHRAANLYAIVNTRLWDSSTFRT